MKPLIHCALLSAFTLSACAAHQPAAAKPDTMREPASPAAAAPATKPTGTWYSERVIRIIRGGDDHDDVFDAVVQQLHSPAVLESVVKSCGLPADATKYVAVQLDERDNRADVRITVDLHSAGEHAAGGTRDRRCAGRPTPRFNARRSARPTGRAPCGDGSRFG